MGQFFGQMFIFDTTVVGMNLGFLM